jgi:hypothetical protein
MAKYQSAFEKRFGKQGSGASLAQRNADNAAFKQAKLRDKMSAATKAASGVGSAKPYQAPIKIKMPKREWSGETSKQLFARIDREMEAGKPPAGRKFDAIKTTYGGDLGNKSTRSADRARANAEMDPTIAATMTHQGRKHSPTMPQHD